MNKEELIEYLNLNIDNYSKKILKMIIGKYEKENNS